MRTYSASSLSVAQNRNLAPAMLSVQLRPHPEAPSKTVLVSFKPVNRGASVSVDELASSAIVAFKSRNLHIAHRNRELFSGDNVVLPMQDPVVDVMLFRASFAPRVRAACEELQNELILIDAKLAASPRSKERTELRRARRNAEEQLQELRRIEPKRRPKMPTPEDAATQQATLTVHSVPPDMSLLHTQRQPGASSSAISHGA